MAERGTPIFRENDKFEGALSLQLQNMEIFTTNGQPLELKHRNPTWENQVWDHGTKGGILLITQINDTQLRN